MAIDEIVRLPFDDTFIVMYRNTSRVQPALATSPGLETVARKKISTTIYITPEQNEQLRVLNERTKVPVAVYIREGIDLVIQHYKHLLPGQSSLLPDDPSGEHHSK
jgi:hypothetical protein